MNCVIVGYGFVGKATGAYLEDLDIDVYVHDPAAGFEANREKDYDFGKKEWKALLEIIEITLNL